MRFVEAKKIYRPPIRRNKLFYRKTDRKGTTMTQLAMFEHKPILEVLKPVEFINGNWQICENKKTLDFQK